MRFLSVVCVLAASLTPISTDTPAMKLHAVPLSVRSPRLLGMSRDKDGFLWFGSTHRVLLRYDPRTGATKEIKLPFDSSTSETHCVGEKVYLLGQSYPKLMCYDRASETFREFALPTATPNIWYGTLTSDGKSLYLFDRNNPAIIKWDTQTDTGKTIAYPYQTPMPAAGRLVPKDGAIWCSVWDFTDGQYLPVGIARLDLKKDEFTGFYPFPAPNAEREPYADPDTTLFYPRTLKGELVPFDFKAKQWRKSIPVPEYGKKFGFIGGSSLYKGRHYFSLSTYNGTKVGCDGKPFHFYNGLLEFDPRTGRFAFPTLDAPDAYYQVSYHLSVGGRFFATGNNIRDKDGNVNGVNTGEAILWQSQPIAKR